MKYLQLFENKNKRQSKKNKKYLFNKLEETSNKIEQVSKILANEKKWRLYDLDFEGETDFLLQLTYLRDSLDKFLDDYNSIW